MPNLTMPQPLLPKRRLAMHGIPAILSLAVSLAAAAEPAAPNYEEHVKPIFRQYCVKCHGDDKQNADVNLQSFDSVLRGGSGGKVVVAGRSAQSLLFKAITNPDDEARMPPASPPLPEDRIAVIRKWIDGGLLASAGGTSLAKARDNAFVPPAEGQLKQVGPPPMPLNLPALNLPASPHPLPILALAASPRAPLAAVAGMRHVRLIHTETEQELGWLPFPEGVPRVIRFSRDGSVLLVAGGKPVQSGRAVLYNVVSGKRLTEIGDEIDEVLAADLSPDQKLVAIGGPGKVVKVYSTSDGSLQYKIVKHVDWITALAFSPDGTKLATADRAGAVQIWDARNGGALLTLAEHKAAVHALDWRSDGRVLATAGEDGLLIWWDVTDGWPMVSKANAHPPQRPPGVYGQLHSGVLGVAFGPNGNLLSIGRDHVARLWNPAGNQLKSFPVETGLPTAAAIAADGKTLLCGDSLGKLHVWRVTE